MGLMVIDKINGRITEVNPQAVAMSGYSREQIIGQDRQRFFICPIRNQKLFQVTSVVGEKTVPKENWLRLTALLCPY